MSDMLFIPETHPDGRCICCDFPLVQGRCPVDVSIEQELDALWRCITEGLVSDYEAFMWAGRIPAYEALVTRKIVAARALR